MERFQCEKCGKLFENEGVILEYYSPVYGPCSKRVADCPNCGNESDTYRPVKRAKSKPSSCADEMPVRGACPLGGGCCTG